MRDVGCKYRRIAWGAAIALIVTMLFALVGAGKYSKSESSIGNGVSLLAWTRRGPLPGHAWAVKFAMSAREFRIAVAMNPGGSNVTAAVSDLAREANVRGRPLAGINADAFGYDKAKMENPACPFGLVISGGKMKCKGASWLNQTNELFLVETEARELCVAKPSFPMGKVGQDLNDVVFENRRAREAIHVLKQVVKDGEIVQGDSDAFVVSPGTYFGFGKDIRMMLVTDGRRMSCPLGLSTKDVATLFCKEGCTEVVQFDGGGSSTLWTTKQGLVNSPCDGAPRRVANALFVVF